VDNSPGNGKKHAAATNMHVACNDVGSMCERWAQKLYETRFLFVSTDAGQSCARVLSCIIAGTLQHISMNTEREAGGTQEAFYNWA